MDDNNITPNIVPNQKKGEILSSRSLALAQYLNSKIPGLGNIYGGIYFALA
jgi:hypothetical protein